MIELIKLTENVHTIGISGHVHPDGDCVGSTLGLYNFLKDRYPNKDIRLYLEEIPEVFDFLHRAGEILHEPATDEFDLYFCLDCGDAMRLGSFAGQFEKAKKTVCIDHHKSNQSFADENFVEPQASSTCELIYRLLPKEDITKEIAECLYTGLVHDTGVFQYSCTAKSTMEAAGFLMERNIDYSRIVDATYYEKTYAQNKILAYAVLKSKLHENGTIISSYLNEAELSEYGVSTKDLDGIVNQLRITKGVECAIFLYESAPSEYKVSMRSKKFVDVSDIAVKHGGGGHARAAGVTLNGEPEEIISMIIEEMKPQMEREYK